MGIFGAKQESTYSNENYKITLQTTELKPDDADFISISTFIPEELSFTLTSEWETLLKNFISGSSLDNSNIINAGINAASTVATLSGFKTPLSQIATYPTWIGNGPIEFQIPFKFNAISNTAADVTQPWTKLLRLVCPTASADNFIVRAPGPTLTIDPETKMPTLERGKVLSLRIGNFIYIRGVIITGITNTMPAKFDINGKPISAFAEVTFRTIFSPTVKDIEQWFIADPNYDQVGNVVSNLIDTFKKATSDPKAFVSGLVK